MPSPARCQRHRTNGNGKRPQLSIVAVPLLPPPRYASAPLFALSLLERTVRRVMKQRPYLSYVESQCAEHGSLCPALYCPDGPSRMEFEPLRMALSKLGLLLVVAYPPGSLKRSAVAALILVLRAVSRCIEMSRTASA